MLTGSSESALRQAVNVVIISINASIIREFFIADSSVSHFIIVESANSTRLYDYSITHITNFINAFSTIFSI